MADFGTVQIVYLVLVNRWPLITEDRFTVNASSDVFPRWPQRYSFCVCNVTLLPGKLTEWTSIPIMADATTTNSVK